MPTTFNDILAGVPAAAVVEAFYQRLLADDELLRHLDPRLLLRFRAEHRAFVAVAGSVGRMMHPSNVRLPVAGAAFHRVLSHLEAVLGEVDVSPAVAAGLVAVLGPVHTGRPALAVVCNSN
jgi:truncated hemoglobin YjbI